MARNAKKPKTFEEYINLTTEQRAELNMPLEDVLNLKGNNEYIGPKAKAAIIELFSRERAEKDDIGDELAFARAELDRVATDLESEGDKVEAYRARAYVAYLDAREFCEERKQECEDLKSLVAAKDALNAREVARLNKVIEGLEKQLEVLDTANEAYLSAIADGNQRQRVHLADNTVIQNLKQENKKLEETNQNLVQQMAQFADDYAKAMEALKESNAITSEQYEERIAVLGADKGDLAHLVELSNRRLAAQENVYSALLEDADEQLANALQANETAKAEAAEQLANALQDTENVKSEIENLKAKSGKDKKTKTILSVALGLTAAAGLGYMIADLASEHFGQKDVVTEEIQIVETVEIEKEVEVEKVIEKILPLEEYQEYQNLKNQLDELGKQNDQKDETIQSLQQQIADLLKIHSQPTQSEVGGEVNGNTGSPVTNYTNEDENEQMKVVTKYKDDQLSERTTTDKTTGIVVVQTFVDGNIDEQTTTYPNGSIVSQKFGEDGSVIKVTEIAADGTVNVFEYVDGELDKATSMDGEKVVTLENIKVDENGNLTGDVTTVDENLEISKEEDVVLPEELLSAGVQEEVSAEVETQVEAEQVSSNKTSDNTSGKVRQPRE